MATPVSGYLNNAVLESVAMMTRIRNFRNHSKTIALIWVASAILFCCVFQMGLRNSSPIDRPNPPASCSSDTPIANEERAILYEKMARDLDEHGAVFLNSGETSQSLSLSDLFALKDGSVTPVLKAVIPPVRANVLYLSPEYSVHISEAVRSVFLPHFDKMIWFQNTNLYHFSMFHASHHIAPVPATEEEIEAEANSVKAVAEGLCPLKIVLDRVVLTSTGVLLGCWQVTLGTDPVTIRSKLRSALPRAPAKQLYDAAILHSSFARLLGRPNGLPAGADETFELPFFHDLVTRLNNQIKGFQATVTELWYVEEFDVLALALDGKMKACKFQLGCS